MTTQDEDEDEMNLLAILQDDDKQETKAVVREDVEERRHYLSSIDSILVTRQLPSQGISFQLWPAATTLVNLLDRYHEKPRSSPLDPIMDAISTIQNRRLRVLELGSGTGLVGIAAAATLGANLVLTDLPHVLPNIQFNVNTNSDILALHGGGRVDVASLRWGEAEDMECVGREFDLVLASDVVYHDHLFDPLLQTLRFFLSGDTKMVFVMAHLRRWKKESIFFKKARKLFDVVIIHSDPPSPGSRIGVVVYSFSARKQNGLLSVQTMPSLIV